MELTILKIETTDLIREEEGKTIYPHILKVHFVSFEGCQYRNFLYPSTRNITLLNKDDSYKEKIFYINDHKKISKEASLVNGFNSKSYELQKPRAKNIKQTIGEINEEIAKHKIILGHNIEDFDKPILEHYGANFDEVVIIDVLKILRNLGSWILTLRGIYYNSSLKHEFSINSLYGKTGSYYKAKLITTAFFNSDYFSSIEFDYA